MWAAPCDPEKDNRFQIMDGNPNHIILRVVYDLRSVLKPSFEWRNTVNREKRWNDGWWWTWRRRETSASSPAWFVFVLLFCRHPDPPRCRRPGQPDDWQLLRCSWRISLVKRDQLHFFSDVRLIDRSDEGRSEEKVKQTPDWDLENEDARLYKPDRNNDAAYFCCCASWGCRVLCIWPWMERYVVPAPARGPHSGPPGSILTAH